MSDEGFAWFMSNYAFSHDDSVAQEFLTQVIIAEVEEQQIFKEAADKLDQMSLGEKAQEYLGYFKDALTEPSPELIEAAASGDGKAIRKALDRGHMQSISGILDWFSAFDLEAADEHFNGEISAGDNAAKQCAAVGETAAFGFVLKKNLAN